MLRRDQPAREAVPRVALGSQVQTKFVPLSCADIEHATLIYALVLHYSSLNITRMISWREPSLSVDSRPLTPIPSFNRIMTSFRFRILSFQARDCVSSSPVHSKSRKRHRRRTQTHRQPPTMVGADTRVPLAARVDGIDWRPGNSDIYALDKHNKW